MISQRRNLKHTDGNQGNNWLQTALPCTLATQTNPPLLRPADANTVFAGLNYSRYHSGDINLSGILTAADANSVFDNLNRARQTHNSGARIPGQKEILQLRNERQYP